MYRIQGSGITDTVIKPIDPKILFDKITEAVNRLRIQIDVGKKKDEKEITESDQNEEKILSFEQIDTLYGNEPSRYNELMDLIIEEYRGHHDMIMKCLLSGDVENFRKTRHSMISNMKLFKMLRMQSILEEIKNAFEENRIPVGGGHYLHLVNEKFSELFFQFEQKQRQLSA
jgi:hypothetical protein